MLSNAWVARRVKQSLPDQFSVTNDTPIATNHIHTFNPVQHNQSQYTTSTLRHHVPSVPASCTYLPFNESSPSRAPASTYIHTYITSSALYLSRHHPFSLPHPSSFIFLSACQRSSPPIPTLLLLENKTGRPSAVNKETVDSDWRYKKYAGEERPLTDAVGVSLEVSLVFVYHGILQ